MAGTVRGTFDLRVTPALTSVRRLETAADRLDRKLQAAGRSMDKIGTPRQIAQLAAYEKRLSSLDGQMGRTLAVSEALQARLDALGRTRVTPQIDLDGIAQALAQVTLLENRLASLGRTRASPTVGLGGGAAAAVGRAAAPGGGGFFGGGGGGRTTGLRAFNIGPLSLGRAAFPLIVGAGLPAARGLIGGAGAVAGSLGMGAAGAGALGVAGGGVLASAIGSIAAVAVPAASGITAASDAMSAFQEAVQLTGRNSAESREALRLFNAELAQAPAGTQRFLERRERVGRRFSRLTAPGQADFTQLGGIGLGTVGALTPQLANQANRFFGAAVPQGQALSRFMTGDRSRRFISSMGEGAAENLGEMERILENVLGTLENIAIAARPFFDDAVDWIEKWTQGWQTGTRNIQDTRGEIDRMLRHLESFGKLTGAAWDLLKDLTSASAPSGRTLMDDLTAQLREWDRWVQRNPREVRNFFRETADDTRSIAAALGDVVDWLNQMAELLRPILRSFEGIAELVATLGPGAIPLLLGARRGLAGAARGGAAAPGAVVAGGGAAARGAAPGFIATTRAAGARGAAGFREQYRGLRGLGATRPTAARGALFGVQGVGGVAAPTAGAIGGSALSRAGGMAAGAARGYLPLAALFAGLQAVGTPGTIGQRAQAAGSSLTFGLIPQPFLGAEQMDVTRETIGTFTSGLPPGLRQQQRALAPAPGAGGGLIPGSREARLVEAAMADYPGMTRREAAATEGVELGGGGPSLVAGKLAEQLEAAGVDAEEAWKAATVWSQKARAQLQKQIRGEEGRQAASGIFEAFGIARRHGKSPEDAFDITAKALEDRANKMKGRAQQTFLDMTNSQLRTLRRAHPELKGEIDKTMDDIAERMSRGAGEFREINNRIVDVSKDKWADVRKAMTSEAATARAQVMTELTRLQKQAVQILRNMGMTGQGARQLITEMERPGLDQPFSGWEAAATQGGGSSGGGGGSGGDGGGNRPRRRGARGTRVQGSHMFGMQDHVPLGGDTVAAGDELIVNRHTERRIDQMLGGTSLEGEVAREQRPHSGPLQRSLSPTEERRMRAVIDQGLPAQRGRRNRQGRRRRGGGGGAGVSLGRRGGSITDIVALGHALQDQGYLVSEHPAFGGVAAGAHTSGSYHYSAQALDVSWPDVGAEPAKLDQLYSQLKGDPGIIELLWRVPDHYDHLHVAMGAGGGVTLGAGALGLAEPMQMRPLRPSPTRTRGLIGAAETRGKQLIAGGMTRQINRKLRQQTGGVSVAGGATAGSLGMPEIEALARQAGMRNPHLMAAIAMAESSGDPGAHGPPDGRGLWQIEWPIWSGQLGSIGNPYNARANAEMAKVVLAQQGLGAWVVYNTGAYQQYMARGGRMASAGALGRGGSFRAYDPTMMMVGDRGVEDIHVTPLGGGGSRGGGAGNVSIGKIEVNLQNAELGTDRDVERVAAKLGAKIAEQAADRIRESRVSEAKVMS